MLKVSFILPCYNVAPYIGRCIESIEHQDIPQEEYEVICVDDCSPDNTGEVIKEYQQKYPNIIYHRHETNKTAGGARNTGIDLAQGKYIWFVDPDDAIVENVLGRLHEVAETRKIDVLFFNKNYTDENGHTTPQIQFHDINEVLTGEQFFLKYCPKKRLAEVTSIWREIFSRDFINQNDLHYPEIKSSQDVVFAWKAYLLAQRVSTIEDVCYNHIRRQNSMTGSKGKLKPIAIISATLLYAEALRQAIDSIQIANVQFMNDVDFEIKCSLNDDSRKVLLMPSNEWRAFYQSMLNNQQRIQLLESHMNRKTKNIFNYHLPYCLWFLMIKGYQIIEKIKK